jgi:hypothetical protein
MLGGLLGGGSQGGGLDQALAPMIEQLMDTPGLSSEMAQSIVAFVLGKLLARQVGGADRLTLPVGVQAGGLEEPAAEGLDLGTLLEQMGSEQGSADPPSSTLEPWVNWRVTKAS